MTVLFESHGTDLFGFLFLHVVTVSKKMTSCTVVSFYDTCFVRGQSEKKEKRFGDGSA